MSNKELIQYFYDHKDTLQYIWLTEKCGDSYYSALAELKKPKHENSHWVISNESTDEILIISTMYAVIEGNAYSIEDGQLMCCAVYAFGDIDFDSKGEVCKNLKWTGIKLVDKIYKATGWIYLADYRMTECL